VKVGDLVRVTSASRPIVTNIGIFVGMTGTWKEWYRIVVNNKELRYDEPFWEFEVLNK